MKGVFIEIDRDMRRIMEGPQPDKGWGGRSFYASFRKAVDGRWLTGTPEREEVIHTWRQR